MEEEIKEYLKGSFTIQEIINIVEMREHLQEDAEGDHWFEINGDNAKLLLKYIQQIETALFYREE